MLVLSRKTQQQILIPGLDIAITVLTVRGNRVQIGIDAPPHIHVTRPESDRFQDWVASDAPQRQRVLAEVN